MIQILLTVSSAGNAAQRCHVKVQKHLDRVFEAGYVTVQTPEEYCGQRHHRDAQDMNGEHEKNKPGLGYPTGHRSARLSSGTRKDRGMSFQHA